MSETLSDRLADRPASAAPGPSFMDLLGEIEQYAASPGDTIARYQDWIGRNSLASLALYAAHFNLGVELSAAGDKAGATDAYRQALALRPGFYPAAINLGTLLEAAGQPDAALATWQQALQPDEARAELLACRTALAETLRLRQETAATVLNAGDEPLPPVFRTADWREVRVDADTTVDAVYTSGLALHPTQDVPSALQGMLRALKPAGFALIVLPDLQEVARHIAEGRPADLLYMAPEGPVAPLDLLYGHRGAPPPRTGFTSGTLAAALIKAGFAAAMVLREPPLCRLTAVAFRTRPDAAELGRVQTRMLPDGGTAAVLFTPAG